MCFFYSSYFGSAGSSFIAKIFVYSNIHCDIHIISYYSEPHPLYLIFMALQNLLSKSVFKPETFNKAC